MPCTSSSESPDASSLANTFLDFFKDKIDRIRTKFLPSHSPDPFLFPPAPPPKLINFIPATLTEIYKLISASENKQCPLDSIPTFLLKLCFNELGPIITNLVNLSLSEGIFPLSFKQALVQPLLKKPSLSTDDLNNFRPISNLIFISKILEKVVASRVQSHLSSNSLSSSFQSAYRIFHSTETTLLKVHNDLILAMDRGEVTSLILLDLSAAFDTVDHSILLTRLQNWFGLDGLSLDWFSSYLSLRSQAVSINDSISAFSTLSCGVPQGSVLGPLLFTLYTTPLGTVISKNSLKYHLYADDTQLYISFTPTNSALSLETLTTTFNDILSRMNLNKLLLNPSKTEFLLIGTKQQRLKFSDLTNLSLSNDIIPVSSVPLLAILASSLTLTCLSLIKSTLYPNLVIFISETSVEFVIFFLSLQPQLLQIHLSPANLTIAIHFTLASHKQISTNFNAFKIHWHVSLQTLQNINTSHQHSKNYTGFLSNKESITKSVFLHTKHLQINNLHIFTIVFHFRHILFLHDLLIHLFFPFHMSDHHLEKGLSLSSVHDSGIHSLLIPETRLLYQYSVPGSKPTSSKLLSLPRLFPISLDCLPGFWFLLFSFYALSNDT